MFEHILIPTDGSDWSLRTIHAGIDMAKRLGARVTGFYAQQTYPVSPFAEYVPPDVISPEEFDQRQRERAERVLATVSELAQAAGVPCETATAVADSPWVGITKAAKEKGCDLIFMASHGRRGLASILLGSETYRVLAHCHIPVLVYREEEAKNKK